jgi:integrase
MGRSGTLRPQRSDSHHCSPSLRAKGEKRAEVDSVPDHRNDRARHAFFRAGRMPRPAVRRIAIRYDKAAIDQLAFQYLAVEKFWLAHWSTGSRPLDPITFGTPPLADYDGDEITKLGLRILILTFVRTGELRFAKWSEFENLDGREPLWRIPAERMKLRRPHLVPLSPQAASALGGLRKLTGKRPLLFPAPTRLGVISENTLLFALYRMGYHNRATVHGFRATASTVLNEAQFNRDWIEIQLAHCDGSIRGAYNFAEWLPGRRDMMSWWADYLDGSASPR